MTPRYSTSVVTSAGAGITAALAEIVAATKPISVTGLRLTSRGLGAVVLLQRSVAVGTGAAVAIATGLALRALDDDPTAHVRLGWSASPTGAGPLRSGVLPSATGSSLDLVGPDDPPIVVEPSSSIALINCASGTFGGSIAVDVSWLEGPP